MDSFIEYVLVVMLLISIVLNLVLLKRIRDLKN